MEILITRWIKDYLLTHLMEVSSVHNFSKMDLKKSRNRTIILQVSFKERLIDLMMMSSCILICIISRLNNAKFHFNTTLRNVSFIMKRRRIEEGPSELIPVKYVHTSLTVQLILSVLLVTAVQDLITELKSFTTLKNIK